MATENNIISNRPALSVIMPVYNTGSKLSSTLNSIVKQSFKDFELLILNDGSTDVKTLQICEKYRQEDGRVKIIHKSNEGIEKTKVLGIEMAQGDYIMFSDHDDYYLPHAFKKLFDKIVSNGADIVVGNYYEQLFRSLPVKFRGFTVKEVQTVEHEEFIKKFYINFFGINIFNVSTWAKIYRSSLLKKIDFITLGYNTTEDVALNIQIFPVAEKVVFTTDFFYVHVRGGITSVPKPDVLLQNYIDLYMLKMSFIEKFKFVDAIPPINYEMKNIIAYYIKLSVESGKSFETVAQQLDNFKTTSVYNLLEKFYLKNNLSDSFMSNLFSNNYEVIFSQQVKETRRLTFKKIAKQILR